jgi:hypothetical protein
MGNQQYARQSLKSSLPIDQDWRTSVGSHRTKEHPVFIEQQLDSIDRVRKQGQDRRREQFRLDALGAHKSPQATKQRTDALDLQS